MDFNWRSPIFTRILLLSITLLGLGYYLFGRFEIFAILILLAAIVYQAKHLLEMMDRSNENITSLLDSIRFDDPSNAFKTTSNDPAARSIHKKLNEAMTRLRNSRRERDSESLFFRNIVMHVGIGIVAFREDGAIEIFNAAARKLLKVNKAENISDLHEVNEALVEIFRKLKTGGRELFRLKINDDIIQLSIYAIELTLKGENVKLISLQNIQSELEEKEMEAWQNLVKVLTHEIMNSVTPISSLAGTIENELKEHLHDESPLTPDELQDVHLSLQTISKRSEGLIQFVREFRSLTSIPKPRKNSISVQSLFDEISMLHKQELADKEIVLETLIYPDDLTIVADKGMIEQVLINLLKNAIQSFEDQTEKKITLRAYVNEKSRPVLSVKDNGTGIDPEALEKIFIPFFTTKKTGSGIGLSLSRQIMREHQGTLSVKSTVGLGTEFFLRF
ncbi:MAG TPA: ATP-binding protein [Cyclobacteriaceae bacterium]|nr:ATP-binding protein [Cyclobacteriaceae bacterium]